MTTKETKRPEDRTIDKDSDLKNLVLFNDPVNTFDFVVKTLIEVCGHDALQAETCTWIAHFKGRCIVKKGTLSALQPCCDEMTFRKLTVEIQ
jgi:ATP-dependent Clp protease adaptor protein ClpS